MPQLSVRDEGAELFVVRVEQFVVDDFGEQVLLAQEGQEFVEFVQPQHGRFFNQDMAARLKNRAGGIEMTVIGRGDAGEVDARIEHRRNQSAPEKLLTPAAILPADSRYFCARCAGARGDGRQRHIDVPEDPVVNAATLRLLEKRAIRLVEDHPHADHAGSEPAVRRRWRGMASKGTARRFAMIFCCHLGHCREKKKSDLPASRGRPAAAKAVAL